MSRLTSLQTPQRKGSASPSTSPAGRSSPSPLSGNGASSPNTAAGRSKPVDQSAVAGPSETTHHRKLKQVIEVFGETMREWDALVKADGLSAGQGVINESTVMDNLLLLSEDVRPAIAPHLERLYQYRRNLDKALATLEKRIAKLSMLVDQAEALYFEAYRLRWSGLEEPLWCTWTFTQFIDSLHALVHLHAAHLDTLRSLASKILDPSTPFEDAKTALERWRDLAYAGQRRRGVLEWQEMLSVEMTFPGGTGDPNDDGYGEYAGGSPGVAVSAKSVGGRRKF